MKINRMVQILSQIIFKILFPSFVFVFLHRNLSTIIQTPFKCITGPKTMLITALRALMP